jgi:antitoxin component of MazEF toxin-antitoxin module
MALTVMVNKWSNAQGIRLPASYCRQLGILAKDRVMLELELVRDEIVVTRIKEAPLEEYTLEGRLRAAGWDGHPYQIEETNWGPDVGGERLFLPIVTCVKSFFDITL